MHEIRSIGFGRCPRRRHLGPCWAQDLKATQKFTETQIGFEPGATYGNYTLTVTGPNGFHATASSKSGAPSIDLRRFGALEDGIYNYHLTASSDEKVPLRSTLDNGRDGGPANSMLKGRVGERVFHVKGGTIVKSDPAAREPASAQK